MVVEYIAGFFTGIMNSIPEEHRLLASLFIYTFFIAIYSFFIWKFYKFLARREIIQLNLSQYNNSTHPFVEKLLAIVLYILEYLVILPFLVLFWFAILSIFLLLLSESPSVQTILLVSAAIIASTRISAYISEDLSKDLAKILPFTILATFLLNPNFFNVFTWINRFSEISSLFNHVLMFIFFIFIIEFVLRLFYCVVQFFYSEDEVAEATETENSAKDSESEEKS
ncbi:hypothetical protein GF386_04725 [Candidatus Pacearchaeota archaeon]|nr:hypothetical protein [Candidatus Pacearchaeota archaeon]MBD3283421.1 hypothetical protein [Candidatus Pacearchaeota archaeon]